MAPLDSGTCTRWPIDTAAACWDVPDTTPQATVDFWQATASEYLWARTGRRLGPSCPITVRPCKNACATGYGFLDGYLNQGQYLSTGGFIPYMANGRMYNWTGCGCDTACNCGPELCQITLPGPVYDIVEVNLNGTVMASSEYFLYDGGLLTRSTATDTKACWPSCQDLSLPPGADNTFAVTYRTGLALTSLATAAVTDLTAHFIRGCNGCGCGTGTRQNLQRLSRQGVELEFVQPSELFGNDRTGIQSVDWFIQSANPYGVASPMRVLSPDAPRYPSVWR